MKKYFYIIAVLAVAAVAVGIGSHVYLVKSLSDVKITEHTQAGDKKYAEGITFSQRFYDTNESIESILTSESDNCWNIDTDAMNPEDSKVTFIQDVDGYEENDHIIALYENASMNTAISIEDLDTVDIGCNGLDENLENAIQDILGSDSVYDDVIYDIIKAASDQVDKGKSKTVKICLKDYTDQMPMIISSNDMSLSDSDAETSSVYLNSMKSILKQLPHKQLTGKEKVKIHIKKNKLGQITYFDFDTDDENYIDDLSVMTEKGLFFTYAGDSDRKTKTVYYVPMKVTEKEDQIFIEQASKSVAKSVVTDENEQIETLSWDEKSDSLLVLTSRNGTYTFASYDIDDMENVQTIQLFGKDVVDPKDDNDDSLETVWYRGDNLWVYVNGTHGLTALQYNSKSDQYDVVMDLACKQAFDGGSAANIYNYDARTRVAYKDGRLAFLYSLDSYYSEAEDGFDEDESDYRDGQTALGVFTEDGMKYLGNYDCSLLDDANYCVSDDTEDEYTLNMDDVSGKE